MGPLNEPSLAAQRTATHKGLWLWLGAAALGATSGCINTDAAVFVEASIDSSAASVQQSALSTGLGGQFELTFHLSARASGDSQVTLRTVSLSNADRSQTLAPSLKVTAAPAFPLVVLQAGDTVVQVSYGADDNLFEASALGGLCEPAGVVVEVLFDDALLGATAVAHSQPFVVQGCP